MEEQSTKAPKGIKEDKPRNHEPGIMETLKNAIGMDLTKFTVPVSYNEPTTFLMRMMEVSSSHIYLLDKANQVSRTDPDLALLFVAIYSLSVFSSGVQRVKHKPFNPLLGETYEFNDREKGIQFVSEQVSHHPPIGASHIESKNFEIDFFLGVETKFTGNAVSSKPFAGTYITLKSTGARYTYQGITSVAHNILFGSLWVDIFGKILIREVDSNRFCKYHCKECDFWSTNYRQVKGLCFADKSTKTFAFSGQWSDTIEATRLKAAPSQSEKTENSIQIPNFTQGSAVVIWKNECSTTDEKPYVQWDMTNLAREACKQTDKYYISAKLPITDSRLRPDRIALEGLDYDRAAKEKDVLEVAQRKRQAERKTVPWIPVYFESVTEQNFTYFKFRKNYKTLNEPSK